MRFKVDHINRYKGTHISTFPYPPHFTLKKQSISKNNQPLYRFNNTKVEINLTLYERKPKKIQNKL
jgi:hypothetical protein